MNLSSHRLSEQQPSDALVFGAETFPHIPLGFCWLCLVDVATVLPLNAPQPPPLQADQTQLSAALTSDALAPASG